MNQLVRITTLSILVAFAAQPVRSAPAVPCEDMLKDLRAAVAGAKLSDADAVKVQELQDKGIERCNADDDKRADEIFTQALALVKK